MLVCRNSCFGDDSVLDWSRCFLVTIFRSEAYSDYMGPGVFGFIRKSISAENFKYSIKCEWNKILQLTSQYAMIIISLLDDLQSVDEQFDGKVLHKWNLR